MRLLVVQDFLAGRGLTALPGPLGRNSSPGTCDRLSMRNTAGPGLGVRVMAAGCEGLTFALAESGGVDTPPRPSGIPPPPLLPFWRTFSGCRQSARQQAEPGFPYLSAFNIRVQIASEVGAGLCVEAVSLIFTC